MFKLKYLIIAFVTILLSLFMASSPNLFDYDLWKEKYENLLILREEVCGDFGYRIKWTPGGVIYQHGSFDFGAPYYDEGVKLSKKFEKKGVEIYSNGKETIINDHGKWIAVDHICTQLREKNDYKKYFE